MIGARRSVQVGRGPRLAPLKGLLPASTWTREWLVTLGRRRALAVLVVVPLLLALPLALGGAPTFWAGMLLTVLCAMVGAVGTGVALSRARGSGMLARLRLVPRPAHRALGGWVVAATTVDLLQLVPAIVVVIVTAGAPPDAALSLLLSVAAVLLLTNTFGCAVALVAGSAGEVLLDVAVLLAPLLFLGGLFTGVPASGWRSWAASVDPFAGLHSAFIAALGGTPSLGLGHVVALGIACLTLSLLSLRGFAGALLERA